jgi:hypothetical protein
VARVDDEQRRTYRVPDEVEGLVVTDVAEDSLYPRTVPLRHGHRAGQPRSDRGYRRRACASAAGTEFLPGLGSRRLPLPSVQVRRLRSWPTLTTGG